MADGDETHPALEQNHHLAHNLVSKPSYSAVLQGKKQEALSKLAPSSSSQQADSQLDFDTDVVPIKPISQFEGKIAVLFPISDKTQLVDKLKYVLIGKFSHGRPSWSTIKDFFKELKLLGTYNISIYDQKHLYIECSNTADFNRIWMKMNWSINGCYMRILKWVPEFSPSIETPIVPVWVRMEGLPLYMFDKEPLWQISFAVGKPLKIDSRNLNRSMLNIARICVEINLAKPLVESFNICFEDKTNGVVKENICVNVLYDSIPPYCSGCLHVGHKLDNCKRTNLACQPADANHNQGQKYKAKVTKIWNVVKSNSGIEVQKGKGIAQNVLNTKNVSQVAADQGRIEAAIPVAENASVAKSNSFRASCSASAEVPSYETVLKLAKGADVDVNSVQEDTNNIQSKNTGKTIEKGADMTDSKTGTTLTKEGLIVKQVETAREVSTSQLRLVEGSIKENSDLKPSVLSNALKENAVNLGKETATPDQDQTPDLQQNSHLNVEAIPFSPSRKQVIPEEEWTTVIRSKKKDKKPRANKHQIGHKEHTMQMELVKCQQNYPSVLVQQIAPSPMQEIEAPTVTQQGQHVNNGARKFVVDKQTWAEEVETEELGKIAQNTIEKEARIEASTAAENRKSTQGSFHSAKLNKFRNLKYCDELDKGKRNKLRRSSSVPPNKAAVIKVLDESNETSDLPIDFNQIFLDPEENEHSWDDIRSKHLVAFSRSASPSGRTSSKFSSLKKKVELLYYLENKACLWDKDCYEETRIKCTNRRTKPNLNSPSHKENHSQSAPQASKRGRGRNRGQHHRKHGKGLF